MNRKARSALKTAGPCQWDKFIILLTYLENHQRSEGREAGAEQVVQTDAEDTAVSAQMIFRRPRASPCGVMEAD